MDFIASLLIQLPGLLLAITIHEYAHGRVAYSRGDPTAYHAGRLTLNPLSHLDPIGTLMLVVAHIGWAKPVPINPYNFRHPREDTFWVSLAGPGTNFVAALALGLVIRVLPYGPVQTSEVSSSVAWFLNPLVKILSFAVFVNLVLAFFNLIPIPPLDGSKILANLLPPRMAYGYAQLERYGPFLLIGLILMENFSGVGIISSVMFPLVRVLSYVFSGRDLVLGF